MFSKRLESAFGVLNDDILKRFRIKPTPSASNSPGKEDLQIVSFLLKVAPFGATSVRPEFTHHIQTSFAAVRSPPTWPVFLTPLGSININLTSSSA